MMSSCGKPLNISELDANRYAVSVHKYGFFLCREGTARILLGSSTYCITRNHLCIYTPNTFFQILERSADLDGVLEEDDVSAYYPVVSSIDIRERLRIRNAPCVRLPEAQTAELLRLYKMVRGAEKPPVTADAASGRPGSIADRLRADGVRHLRYAFCLKVLEAYFGNAPVQAMPPDKGDAVLNRFLVSVYEHCHRQRTVRFYADEQNLSPYYFSALVKERSGRSALQWIANVTMIFSRQYLCRPDMSIKEIAARLNFPDQSAFGRYFKHYAGCTPSDFRAGRCGSIVAAADERCE